MLQKEQLAKDDQSSQIKWGAAAAFPGQPESSWELPVPQHLQQLIPKEWAHPARTRDAHKPSARLYSLVQKDMEVS